MLKFYPIPLVASICLANIIHVPTDSLTIQSAVNGALAGDTVLVANGNYIENILIEKDLFLLSENGADSTVINGSGETMGSDLASTIVIRPESNTTHHPVVYIQGFTLNGGGGSLGEIVITGPEGNTTIQERLGGGVYAYVCNPTIKNSKFLDNGANRIRRPKKGGAVFAINDPDGIDFPTRNYVDHPDLLPVTDPLDLSSNTFLGNNADEGHSVYIQGFAGTITQLSNGYFDVYEDEMEGSSTYWIKGPDTGFDESAGDGMMDAILGDVYVSPLGDNILNNGLSWESPFQTLTYALSMVYADSLNPAVVHLAEGTYSPATGESFPIYLPGYIILVGEDEELTILNGIQSNTIISVNDELEISISYLTITGGYAIDSGTLFPDAGGGMTITNARLAMDHVTVRGNSATYGAGLYISNSDPSFSHVNVKENSGGSGKGGGIYLNYSNPEMNYVTISGNSAGSSGGIHLNFSDPILNHVIFIRNTAIITSSGVMSMNNSNPAMNRVTITENESPGLTGVIELNQSNPLIVNSIIWGNGTETPFGENPWEGNNPNIHNCSIEGGFDNPEFPNFDYDPLFVNPENDDYSLQDTSLCIDAGIAICDHEDIFQEYEDDDYDDGWDDDDWDDYWENGEEFYYYGVNPDLGAMEWYPEPPDYQAGDVNMDGTLNVLDIVVIIDFILGNQTLSPEQIFIGDNNEDGLLNVLDIVMIVELILNN